MCSASKKWVLDNSVLQKNWTHNEQLESKISTWWGFLYQVSFLLQKSEVISRLRQATQSSHLWHVERTSPLSHQLIVLESQPGSTLTCQTCSINETCALLVVYVGTVCRSTSQWTFKVETTARLFQSLAIPLGMETHLYTQNAEPNQRPGMQKLHSWSYDIQAASMTFQKHLVIHGDPYKANIQQLSCWLFCSFNFSFQSTYKSRSTSRLLSSGGSNSPAPYTDAAWMDTKWLRLQCHSRHLARSLIEFWKFWVVDRIPTRINLSNFQIKEMKKSCLQILPAWARHPGIPHLWGPGDKAALQHPSVAAHDASDSLEHVERRNVTNFPAIHIGPIFIDS